MSIRWLGKSYGVLDLGGMKAVEDQRLGAGQSLLASQLDTRVASLAVEQQTLRTTANLTQDALRKAIDAVTEDAAALISRQDRLERTLAGGREPPVDLSPKYMTAGLSAAQTAFISSGNHVEFDTAVVDSGHIKLSTGAGQADGIFTLPEELWMIRLASASVDFSANTGVLIVSLRQSSSGAGISPFCRLRPYNSVSQTADAQNTEGILDTRGAGSVDIELRIEAGTGSVSQINTATRVTIFSLA